MRRAPRRFAVDRDLTLTGATAAIYSFALGAATVLLPLVALHAGYGKSVIGYLTAASALAQMAVRLGLGAVMRRYPDRVLITAAGMLLAASAFTVAASTAPGWFLAAELLQGGARGCFWTGSQTHVVRGSGSPVARLAMVNFVSSIGLLAGPLAAGLIGEGSLTTALLGAAAVALVSAVLPLLLRRLPPFNPAPDRRRGTMWLRPGVDLGCFAGMTAGGWRGLVSAYVPVVLVGAGEPTAVVGLLVAVANGASIAGSAVVAPLRHRQVRAAIGTAVVAVGAATALVAAVAGQLVLEVVVLAVSGLGAGALQTLGPAVATDAVHPEERGDAIALAGAFRAGALFVSPLAVGAGLLALPIAATMAAAGGMLALPAILVGRRTAPAQRASSSSWT